MNKNINIPGRLHSVATDGQVAGANEIYDDEQQKFQGEINAELHEEMEGTKEVVDGFDNRVKAIEDLAEISIEGGEVQVANTAEEIVAGSGKVPTANAVAPLKENILLGAVYDVSAKNPTAGTNSDGKWESLSALLSDANLNTLIPTSVRKGGMSIKFVQSSDNKYVQYRYMSSSTAIADFTNVANWQGVDDEPTAGSDNLIKSGGVYKTVDSIRKPVLKTRVNTNIKEGSDYFLNYTFANLGISTFKIKIDKISGNLSVYSIRLRKSDGSANIVLQNSAVFGTEYTFENVNIAEYPDLFIYREASQSTPIPYEDTSYNLIVTNPNSLEAEVEGVNEQIDTLSDDITACQEDIDDIEQVINGVEPSETIVLDISGAVKSGIQYASNPLLEGDNFTSKIINAVSNYTRFAFSKTNSISSWATAIENGDVIFFQSTSAIGTNTQTDIAPSPSVYPYIAYQKGEASNEIQLIKNIPGQKGIEERLDDDDNGLAQIGKTLNFVGKKIMMFGDSITQLPRTGSSTSEDGIVEYFAEKTGASVYRGAVGGSHLSSRNAVIPSSITTLSEAKTALDVVNMVTAWASGNLSLQESAAEFPGIDTYLPTIIGTLQANPISSIDIVTVFAGTNDAGNNVTIGEDDSVDITTIKGAINKIVEVLCKANPEIKIFFFTPIPRWWDNTEGADWNNNLYWSDNYGTKISIDNVSDLGALTEENCGKIYKIRYGFTTTSDFVKYVTNTTYAEDSGREIGGWQYVGIINTAAAGQTPIYKYVKLDGTAHNLMNYVTGILEGAKKNHIPVCNLYDEMGWNVWNFRNFCVGIDGTHPKNGFQHIATKMVGFILSHQNKW